MGLTSGTGPFGVRPAGQFKFEPPTGAVLEGNRGRADVQHLGPPLRLRVADRFGLGGNLSRVLAPAERNPSHTAEFEFFG
jgi:hypothetical protein